MLQWAKLGKVFDPHDHDTPFWMDSFAQAPSAVVEGNFVRVYFSCRPKPDASGQYISYSAFVDLDRNNLQKIVGISSKPVMELGDLGTFDQFGTYPMSVLKENGIYHAYYGGWTRCESVPFNVAIGYAISQDGKSFEKVGKGGPVVSYSPHEPFVISGPKIRKYNNVWHLFYISGSKWIPDNGKPEPVYKIRLATSSDGTSWEKKNIDLIPWRIEADEAQASPDVFFHNGKYHMFFCYRHSKNYRNSEFGYRIGYASSVDLLEWKRDDAKAGLDVSAGTGWDSEMVSYPHILPIDNQIYMFYLGNSVGKTGFGLAKLLNIEDL